ncbi:MAG TPA: helix-turn-helix domain-containing protein [Gemmata sp.]
MKRSPGGDYRAVWDALAEHARITGRAAPSTFLAVYGDGAVVEVRGGDQVADDWGDTPGPFPAAVGWSFRAGAAAHNGRAFAIGGVRGRLLRALVAGAGAPVRDRVLKARVWGDGDAEDGRLKDVAFNLRALLRAELELGEEVDPVERVEGGYRLAVG